MYNCSALITIFSHNIYNHIIGIIIIYHFHKDHLYSSPQNYQCWLLFLCFEKPRLKSLKIRVFVQRKKSNQSFEVRHYTNMGERGLVAVSRWLDLLPAPVHQKEEDLNGPYLFLSYFVFLTFQNHISPPNDVCISYPNYKYLLSADDSACS